MELPCSTPIIPTIIHSPVLSDEHASGPLWFATPLVVIDVYEHAFYIDYQNKKADYIEKFMRHIDWTEANRRFLAPA